MDLIDKPLHNVDLAKEFDNFIVEKFKEKQEVMHFLLNHERKQLCIDNLQYEIRLAEWRCGMLMTKENKRYMVKSIANFFAENALRAKEYELKSHLEKIRQLDDNLKIKRALDEVEDETKEEFENIIKVYQS